MKGLAKSSVIVLLIASLLLNGCAKQIDNEKPETTTPPITTTEEAVTTKDPNIPSFTVAPVDETTAQTTEAPKSDNTQSNSSGTTQTEATTTQAPITSHEDITVEDVTNNDGKIVDDFLSEMVFDTEDPNELYDMFGLDRNERKAYYDKISKEHNFPIIHVSTENEKEVLSLENYVNCLVEVFNCDSYYQMDAVSGGIRVRGNASAFYGDVDKIRKNGAPYRIKFTNRQNLLGLNDDALCKSWVLLRTYDTGVSDYLALKLAAAINQGEYYSSDCAFVQLYINEEYAGIYVLCEQNQVNDERVDVYEPEEGYTGTDIGYLVELDNYGYSEENKFLLNYNNEKITDVYGTSRVPRKYYYTVKNDVYSEEQVDFIERYFEIAWEIPMRAIRDGEFYKVGEDKQSIVLAQDEFSSAKECIEQIWDIQSVVDMYITHELTNNQDVGGGSFYFAIDFSEGADINKMTCVAPWDFDWAYADYYSDADGGLYAAKFKDSNFVDRFGDRTNPWLVLFYSADWFQDMVKNTWRDRVSDIADTTAEVRATVENNTADLNKDGKKRSGRAKSILSWVESRIEYLSEIWG